MNASEVFLSLQLYYINKNQAGREFNHSTLIQFDLPQHLPKSKRLHKFFQSENINFFALVCPLPLPLYQDSYLLLFQFCFN